LKGYKVGAQIEAKVMARDARRKILCLSVKRIQGNPLDEFLRLNNSKVVDVLVTKVHPYGAEVGVPGSDIKGFIPVREMAWGYVNDTGFFAREGEKVQAVPLHVDATRNHLVFSIKRIERNDYAVLAEAQSVNQEVHGKVKISNFDDRLRVRIELGDSRLAEGYIHKSEISNVIYVTSEDIGKIFDSTQEYHFLIKRFDERNEVIELTRKKLLKDKESALKYGSVYKGRVVQTDHGLRVAYCDDLEGILVETKGRELRPFQSVEVIVARIDAVKKRVEVAEA
jgi:ribosomal protein S1